MSTVQNAFKHNKARKNVIYGGAAIMLAITIISMFSSFAIYKPAFTDIGGWRQSGLALFCVFAVEGAFIWLVYGFTKAFSSLLERLISLAGIGFLLAVMAANIVTHAMQSKGYTLTEFQTAWLEWGAYSVLIAILVLVLLITIADPVSRLLRLELRVAGKEQEAILDAKSDALGSERIVVAMSKRADSEAERLARQIEGNAGYVLNDDSGLDGGGGLNGHPVYANRSDDRGKV